MNALIGIFLSLLVSAAMAAESDPQARLKEAERLLHVSDTQSALRNLRECLVDPNAKEWMIEEAVKLFSANFRAPSDGPSAQVIFSQALRTPRAGPVIASLLSLMLDYPWLTGDEKLSVLSGLKWSGKAGEDILDAQIQLMRRMGRFDQAFELAARQAQTTARLDHRVQVVDLLLDLSRSTDAVALSNSILAEIGGDPAAYSSLAERFYRHGDYRNALDIHRRARTAFSNPMLFFDQSLSICQGLQLGREGIELYLPVLLGGPSPVPEFFRDFLSLIADTPFLMQEYAAWILKGQNPNLYLAALPRFSEMASDADCLQFVRQYRQHFENDNAHIALSEHLLERSRRPAFLAVLNDLPDSPVEVAEAKRLLLFKDALKLSGPDRAMAQFPPASYAMPPVRAAMLRLASYAFLNQSRLSDAIFSLKAAQELSPEAADHLRLAKMYFLAGFDSDALAHAHRAHSQSPSDETLYWLGWLSYLRQDTETARKAFRDVVVHPDSVLSDESLAWLITMGQPSLQPSAAGQAMRDAMRAVPPASKPPDNFPVAVRLALRREALRAGLAGKDLPEDASPYMMYLRWESLDKKDRGESQYQKLLRDSPEYLRNLIRIEEP